MGDVELVLEALEHAGGEFADVLVVVHEQDPAGAEAHRGRAAGLDVRGRAGLGQKEGEGRAGADRGIDADLAAVAPHEFEHGGEAQAGAVFLGGEIGGEDLLQVFARDAAAVVLDLELHIGAGRQRRDLALGEHGIGGAQPHVTRAARRHGLNGVDHEVLKDLQHLRAIGVDAGRADGHFDLDFNAGAGGGDARGLVERRQGRKQGPAGAPSLGQGQEFPGQGAGGEAGVLAILEDSAVGVVLGERDAVEDRRQEIIEAVGDPARERAGSHTPGLARHRGGRRRRQLRHRPRPGHRRTRRPRDTSWSR